MNASPNNSSDTEKRQTLTQTAKFAGDKKGIIITTFFAKVTDCTKEKSGVSQTRKVSPSLGLADTGATNQTKENAGRDNSEEEESEEEEEEEEEEPEEIEEEEPEEIEEEEPEESEEAEEEKEEEEPEESEEESEEAEEEKEEEEPEESEEESEEEESEEEEEEKPEESEEEKEGEDKEASEGEEQEASEGEEQEASEGEEQEAEEAEVDGSEPKDSSSESENDEELGQTSERKVENEKMVRKTDSNHNVKDAEEVNTNDEEYKGEVKDNINQEVLTTDKQETQTDVSAANRRVEVVEKNLPADDSTLDDEVDDNANNDEPTYHPD